MGGLQSRWNLSQGTMVPQHLDEMTQVRGNGNTNVDRGVSNHEQQKGMGCLVEVEWVFWKRKNGKERGRKTRTWNQSTLLVAGPTAKKVGSLERGTRSRYMQKHKKKIVLWDPGNQRGRLLSNKPAGVATCGGKSQGEKHMGMQQLRVQAPSGPIHIPSNREDGGLRNEDWRQGAWGRKRRGQIKGPCKRKIESTKRKVTAWGRWQGAERPWNTDPPHGSDISLKKKKRKGKRSMGGPVGY